MNAQHLQYQCIIELYVQAYNERNVVEMTKNLHSDIVFENVSDGQINFQTTGIEEFTAQANAALAYFSQRRQTITSWEFRENTVAVGIDYQAVAAVDLPNGSRAGDRLELQGSSEFTFHDDRIIGIKDKS